MMEYTFYVKGTHRQTTVGHEDILRAARDAASLLYITDDDVLLWLPPLPLLTKRVETKQVPTLVQVAERHDSERPTSMKESITIDLVSMGRALFPILLERAGQYWHQWKQHHEADREARLRSTLMICGAIDVIPSAAALEQVRSHLLMMSEMPVEIMPPAFEVALQELVSLQAIFKAPYERLAYVLFLQVLALACLAVPLEQEALDQLRDALSPIERCCSAQLHEIEAEREEVEDDAETNG